MLRRAPIRRPEPPPSLARVREWHGAMPSPKVPATPVCVRPSVVLPLLKECAVQHSGYMNLVRALHCVHCYAPPRSEFCHADEGKGTGIKTDCRRGYPACKACHYLIGSTGLLGKRERQRIEVLYGAETRAKVIAAGLWPKRLPRWQE